MGIGIQSVLFRKGLKREELGEPDRSRVSINLGLITIKREEKDPDERHYRTISSFYLAVLHDILGEEAFLCDFYCEDCQRLFEQHSFVCPLCGKEF